MVIIITSSVNVVTYDGIDKKGGVLRDQTGTINTIQKVVILIQVMVLVHQER